ncbi:glutamine-hydrolyzing GMP synthase [Candidatus Wolfebacteria bacterium]|nr:glutamine-hydrolyzing GMP synthase [Candidatus Wolfebacteria bacterium]
MKQANRILIFDFGGQYAHLIGRRVRGLGYDAEIVPPTYPAEKITRDPSVKALILSGGAQTVYEKNAPRVDRRIFKLGLPILGICYGHQVIAHYLGGKVKVGTKSEYGPVHISIERQDPLFLGLDRKIRAWMNHRDSVVRVPAGFKIYAASQTESIAAFGDDQQKIYGVQFHPEVEHTLQGKRILANFLRQAAGATRARGRGGISHYIENAKQAIGKERAIMALSGGVDSSVAAALVSRAIGKNFIAVYVDTGLMRKGETAAIIHSFRRFPFRLRVIRAAPRFFRALKGVIDPERKRKRIGRLFIEIFEEEAKRSKAKYLVQGTIYSDWIESGSTKHSSKIKSHHNVGGLPRKLNLKLYEPIRELYKDEVRELGRALGLPDAIVRRKAFPGPGLAIRILGEVTPEKVRIVQDAGAIIEEELSALGLWRKIYMAFPVLLSIKSTGVQGDRRTYKYPIVLRVIESKDVMTTNFSRLPYAVLERISSRITNEIPEVNRVVYDITNKPPATMEWE